MSFAMPFSRDIKTYIAELQRDIQSQVLLGGPHDPMSLALADIIGMNRALIEGDTERLVQEYIGDYSTMPCDKLYLAGAKIGLPLRGAVSSRGFANFTGIAGTVIPATLTITTTGGVFAIDPSRVSPAAIPASGTAVIPIIAQDAGSDANQLQPGQGVLSSNLPGIQTLVTNITSNGGVNVETCDEYRARLSAYETYDKTPGSRGWHISRVLRYPGVIRVCVDTCACCDNEIGLYPFFGPAYPNGIPTSDLVAQMQSEIFSADIGSGLYASRIIGISGSIKRARAAGIKVKYSGIATTVSASRNAITANLAAYFSTLCPGASLCRATILSIATQQGLCPRRVSFEYLETDFQEDEERARNFDCVSNEITGGFLVAGCNVLPVLTEVCFVL